jgi:hypothetical protein
MVKKKKKKTNESFPPYDVSALSIGTDIPWSDDEICNAQFRVTIIRHDKTIKKWS